MFLSKLVDQFKNPVAKTKEEPELQESLQAKILVSRLSYNNSVMFIDENGESHTAPVPAPVEEELLVKQGDRVSGFEIAKITANFIELKSLLEYTEGKSSTPRTQFLLEMGECIELYVYGLCDAVEKISFKYVEAIEPVEGDMDIAETNRQNDEFVVSKTDWETYPMPEKNAHFTINRKFSDADISRIKKGHIPEEMEDKWFYYYEDGKAYYHRSWSGNCIYIVEFDFKTNKHLVTVNRDKEQYSNTDIGEDTELINYLLGM